MRILRFMGYPINNFSSLENFVHSQAVQMKKMGHDLEIVYDNIADSGTAIMAQQFGLDIRVHFDFTNLVKSRTISARVSYFFRAFRLIHQGEFDIVHAYFDPSARILNCLSPMLPKVRFLRTLGSYPHITGKTFVIRKLRKLYLRANLYNYDVILCISEPIRDALVALGIKPSKLVVIHSVTDTSRFHRYIERLKHPRIFCMTYLGRLEPIKNVETLIKGVRLLVHTHRKEDLCLNIFGAGSQDASLHHLVEREGLQQWIKFHGRSDEVVRILNEETDVYVQASHSEGLSASVLEAMACELPVVVSYNSGHQTMVADEINGLLFRPDDPSEFAAKILELKDSHTLRERLARKARETIVGRFDVAERIRQEKDVYMGLL